MHIHNVYVCMLNTTIEPFCPEEIYDVFVLRFYDYHLHNSISLKGNITTQYNTWQRLLARTTPTPDPLMSCRQTFCFISYLLSWTINKSLIYTEKNKEWEHQKKKKQIVTSKEWNRQWYKRIDPSLAHMLRWKHCKQVICHLLIFCDAMWWLYNDHCLHKSF